MKKILCLLFASLMLFAACSGKQPETPPSAQPWRKDNSKDSYAVKTASLDSFPDNPNTSSAKGEQLDNLWTRWSQAMNERRQAGKNEPDMERFSAALFGAMYEEGKNLVYSPVNIYMALAMLAETTDGAARDEILSALGAENIEALRENVKAVMKTETFDDGANVSLISDSVWINPVIDFKEDVLETLADVYRADSFSGDFADPDYVNALRSWLSEHTRGLLEDSVKGLEIDPGTKLALASAIYFKAAWSEEFQKSANTREVFHGANGDKETDFMHCTEHMSVCLGGSFTAVRKGMKNGEGFWMILPKEGVSLSDAMNEWMTRNDPAVCGEGFSSAASVRLSMPKLDVDFDADLLPVMSRLGIRSCLVPGGDFSPLTDYEGLYVAKAAHAARLIADEEGVEAAAYTVMLVADGGFFEQEVIDFTLDRPFIFVLTGVSGAPLFTGAVNVI